MAKEKNNQSFLKKKYRKKSFLIRKQASTYIYYSSFNASKKIISFLKITPKDIVGCYWPINNELDTRPLISILSLKNIRIALPIIVDEKMIFKTWKSSEKLYFSKYKFYSPHKSATTLTPSIIITPALAVDFNGNRIGYGSGFYDNYYNKNKSKYYIGYVYSKQIFNTLPFAKHDLKLNAIVTESFVKKINHINK